jgi:putative ABC transport system substrate-binding protein
MIDHFSVRSPFARALCLVALLFAFFAASCNPPRALTSSTRPEKPSIVGFIAAGARQPWHDKVAQGLRESGFAEGTGIRMEYRYADGRPDQLPELVDQLLQANAEVIVAADSRSIQAAMSRTSSVPIVMAISGDPVGSGFVDSLARPGRNVTGLTNTGPELAGKRLELLKDIVPGLTKVGVMANGRNDVTDEVMSQLSTAATTLGLELAAARPMSVDEIGSAFDSLMAAQAQAIIVLGDPLFAANQDRIESLLADTKIPTLMDTNVVEKGGLVGYGPVHADLFRRSGIYAAEILRGAKPADLPVEQPTQFELIVNLKTAETLGITIPRSVLLQADRIIQ